MWTPVGGQRPSARSTPSNVPVIVAGTARLGNARVWRRRPEPRALFDTLFVSPIVTDTHAQAIVFFCHGSSDPAWRAPFDLLVERYRKRHPGRRIHLAFLERMAPALPDVIDELATELCDDIRIVPLFLAPGGHTERDLPAILREAHDRWPELRFTVEPTLAERDRFHDAVLEWVDDGSAATTIGGDEYLHQR